MNNQYAERDIMEQKHYAKHVFQMTSEKLHSKSDIAAELAHRDELIETLTKRLSDFSYEASVNMGKQIQENKGLYKQIAELKADLERAVSRLLIVDESNTYDRFPELAAQLRGNQ